MGNLPESIQLFLHVLALGLVAIQSELTSLDFVQGSDLLRPEKGVAKSLPASARKAEVLATGRWTENDRDMWSKRVETS